MTICTEPLSIILDFARKLLDFINYLFFFNKMLIAFFPNSLTGNEAAVIGGELKSLTNGPSKVTIEISLPIFNLNYCIPLWHLKLKIQ